MRERGAETGRCELDRRGSADARGPAGSGRVRAERSARAEALAVGSGAQGQASCERAGARGRAGRGELGCALGPS